MGTRDYIVGEWTVGSSENALRNAEREITLEPLLVALLVYLAEHAGRTVTKVELAHAVWKCKYISDDVLSVAIFKLRKSLSDSPRQPRYIQTVSRKGYRLIAPVSPAPVRSVAANERNEGQRRRRPTIQMTVFAAASIVAIAIAAAVYGPPSPRRSPSAEVREAYARAATFSISDRRVDGGTLSSSSNWRLPSTPAILPPTRGSPMRMRRWPTLGL